MKSAILDLRVISESKTEYLNVAELYNTGTQDYSLTLCSTSGYNQQLVRSSFWITAHETLTHCEWPQPILDGIYILGPHSSVSFNNQYTYIPLIQCDLVQVINE